MRLESRARNERAHVIEESVNIHACIADGHADGTFEDSIPRSCLGAREGEGACEFCRRTADTREYSGRLRSGSAKDEIVLYGNSLESADVSDLALLKAVGGERLCVDGKSHRVTPLVVKRLTLTVAVERFTSLRIPQLLYYEC